MEQNFKNYKTNEYLDAYVDSENFYDRIYAANQNYALDILKNDTNKYVREAVAINGAFLDELSQDSEPVVSNAAKRHILKNLQDERAELDKKIQALKNDLENKLQPIHIEPPSKRDIIAEANETTFFNEPILINKKKLDIPLPKSNTTYQAEYCFQIGESTDKKPLQCSVIGRCFGEKETTAYLTKLSISDLKEIPVELSLKLQNAAQAEVRTDYLQMPQNLITVLDKFNGFYENLYENGDNYHETYDPRKAIEFADNFIRSHNEFVNAFNELRNDFLSSDREVIAFAYALADTNLLYKEQIQSDISNKELKSYYMGCGVKCKLPEGIDYETADIGEGTDFDGDYNDNGVFVGRVHYEVTVTATDVAKAKEMATEMWENADFGDLEDLEIIGEWNIYEEKNIEQPQKVISEIISNMLDKSAISKKISDILNEDNKKQKAIKNSFPEKD